MFVAGCFWAAAALGAPDLVPLPKSYRETGPVLRLAAPHIFIESSRQCEIAAEEVRLRIAELGGVPPAAVPAGDPAAPGIYILTAQAAPAARLMAMHQLQVTAADPGPQGYVLKTAAEQIIIIGSDSVGALYGAMTFRQLMKKAGAQVVLPACAIRDWPDFRYRSSISFQRGLERLAYDEKTPAGRLAACKAGFDLMLRFKMNMVFDYNFSRENIWDMPADRKKFIAAANAYAAERGIYPANYDNTAAGNYRKGAIPKPFQNWPCVQESRGGKYSFSCWSDDELQRAKIEKTADVFRECNFRMVLIHPVDGGAIEDPEQWSRRCPACRQRWKDDERWKATAHQLGMWVEIFRERAPGIILESPVYPYNAVYSVRARFPNVSDETWRRNSVDFWTNLHRELDPGVPFGTWTSWRLPMAKYRECFPGRSVSVCSPYQYNAGIFSTSFRRIAANYFNHPDDMFVVRGTDGNGNWLTLINCCEFAWNTGGPGNDPEYNGLFYDPETDHTQPEEIIRGWLPQACRNFYGDAAGDLITPLYQSGVQPFYVADPGRILDRANKARRAPLADVDPDQVSSNSDLGRIAPDIVDTPERMAAQVQAAATSLAALEAAWPLYDTIPPAPRKIYIYHYRRMPQIYAVARAVHADRAAAALQRAGDFAQASALLEQALANLQADWGRVAEIQERTRGKLDIQAPDKLISGDIPQADKLQAMLAARLADVKLILKPRRPGRYANVGIYRGSGAQGALEFFKQFKNVRAEIIDSLNLSVLDRYDCVFVMKNQNIRREDFFENLRRYAAEGGGGVLIEHDLIGGPRGPFGQASPFPEVCRQGAQRIDGRKAVIADPHPALPGLARGAELDLMYVDWIVPVPGPDGQVLARSATGEAVAVAGPVGAGKVVCSGTVSVSSVGSGYDAEEKLLYGFNAALAQGAVEWFTGLKLTR